MAGFLLQKETKFHIFGFCKNAVCRISFYYINTNEIPSELSRENLISSQVKFHRCYGFIINRTFQSKKLFK